MAKYTMEIEVLTFDELKTLDEVTRERWGIRYVRSARFSSSVGVFLENGTMISSDTDYVLIRWPDGKLEARDAIEFSNSSWAKVEV